METIDVLIAARKRIETPDRWCQGEFARHANGQGIGAQEANACRWCAEGAILAETGSIVFGAGGDAFAALLRVVRKHATFTTLHDFNDSRTHREVLAIFDEAIASVPQGETK